MPDYYKEPIIDPNKWQGEDIVCRGDNLKSMVTKLTEGFWYDFWHTAGEEGYEDFSKPFVAGFSTDKIKCASFAESHLAEGRGEDEIQVSAIYSAPLLDVVAEHPNMISVCYSKPWLEEHPVLALRIAGYQPSLIAKTPKDQLAKTAAQYHHECETVFMDEVMVEAFKDKRDQPAGKLEIFVNKNDIRKNLKRDDPDFKVAYKRLAFAAEKAPAPEEPVEHWLEPIKGYHDPYDDSIKRVVDNYQKFETMFKVSWLDALAYYLYSIEHPLFFGNYNENEMKEVFEVYNSKALNALQSQPGYGGIDAFIKYQIVPHLEKDAPLPVKTIDVYVCDRLTSPALAYANKEKQISWSGWGSDLTCKYERSIDPHDPQ